MYPTTWANVLVIAPELANAGSLQSTAAQDVILNDASLLMGYYDPWGVKLEIACRFLAAHLATMSLRRGASGQITDVGAGPAKLSYAHPRDAEVSPLEQTSYGVEFRRIRSQIPAFRFAISSGWGYGPWCP
jgi:Protein of unknown function (DUF4054)